MLRIREMYGLYGPIDCNVKHCIFQSITLSHTHNTECSNAAEINCIAVRDVCAGMYMCVCVWVGGGGGSGRMMVVLLKNSANSLLKICGFTCKIHIIPKQGFN